jgi:NADPH-dependent 2,4-dienoyl-CoA reductase/sulfur reductase-like enzyme
MRLLVIGGSDAGIAAALRARELDPSVEATVVLSDAFPNFSICGLPYYISGDVPDHTGEVRGDARSRPIGTFRATVVSDASISPVGGR